MYLGDRSKDLVLGALTVIALVGSATALSAGGPGTSSAPPPPATVSASPGSPSASVSAGPVARRQGIAAVRSRLSDGRPVSITVLGDDSSVGDTSWVHTWAQTLTHGHTVVYHAYNPFKGAYDAPRTLSGQGPRIDVWNASYSSATAPSVTAELDRLDPQHSGVVIINLGHQDNPDTFTTDVQKLWTALATRDDPLGLVMIQNPETVMGSLQHTRMEHLTEIADQLGLPTVDVYAAFTGSGQPLTNLVIGARPTPAGTTIWVDTLTAALR